MTHRTSRPSSRLLPLLVIVALAFPVVATAAPATSASTGDTSIGPVLAKGFGLANASRTLSSVTGLSEEVMLQAESSADAIPLPTPSASGSLLNGESDLFSIDLEAGERIELKLLAPSSGDAVFDLYLYAPGLDQLADVTAIAHATEGPFPRTLSYVVPTGVAGTYHIEVNAWQGEGDYELESLVRPASDNVRKDIGEATPLPIPSTVDFSFVEAWGANKVHKIELEAGRRVKIAISGPADADFDIHLYRPDTESIIPTDTIPVASGNLPTSNEQIIYDVPGGAGGTYFLEIYRFSGAGDGTLSISDTLVPAAPAATRVWGQTRYETAAAISAETFPAGSQTALLASGTTFADGIAASSLAGALRVPIVLASSTSLPKATALELKRLGVNKVYIIGGSLAIGDGVERAVKALGDPAEISVERVKGANRYETAKKVALKTREVTGKNPEMIFLASGEDFPDALALSPVAFSGTVPILLTRTGTPPGSTKTAVTELKGSNHYDMDVLVAGGPAAVSVAAAAEVAALAGGELTRVAGQNRYFTALEIAEHAVLSGWSDPETVAVASGATFPDALAGAPLSGMRGGTMLLTSPKVLSAGVRYYLQSFDFAVNECWVLGGSGAVHDAVLSEIRATLPAEPLKR